MGLRNPCQFFCVIIYYVFLKYPHVSDAHKIQNNQNGIGKGLGETRLAMT